MIEEDPSDPPLLAHPCRDTAMLWGAISAWLAGKRSEQEPKVTINWQRIAGILAVLLASGASQAAATEGSASALWHVCGKRQRRS